MISFFLYKDFGVDTPQLGGVLVGVVTKIFNFNGTCRDMLFYEVILGAKFLVLDPQNLGKNSPKNMKIVSWHSNECA